MIVLSTFPPHRKASRTANRTFSPMKHLFVFLLAACCAGAMPHEAAAQRRTTGQAQVQAPAQVQSPQIPMQITWEVRNRFRLFREERDFLLHVDAMRSRSVLEAEQVLAQQSEGRGWARNMVSRLCIEPSGRVAIPCQRDGVREDYITPAAHAVTVQLGGAVPDGATCTWLIEDGSTPRNLEGDCRAPINLRVTYGITTTVMADVMDAAGMTQRVTGQIAVRDFFIAGLGDSIASGEGNPDRPVALSDGGFCFRRYGAASGQYYRPGRAGFKGGGACENTPDTSSATALEWQRRSAQWFNAACHRSLYSYQTRTAIAIAVNNPHIAVTYLPLACTGATVGQGLLGSQRARECIVGRNALNCSGSVPAQITELRDALNAARKRQPSRELDLVLLSVGANDIDFSGLVADVIVDEGTERSLFSLTGVVGSLGAARSALQRDLPGDFARLRTALKPLVNNDMSKVVFTTYGNPALQDGAPCPGGRDGFDIHPAFRADGDRLAAVATFVQREFLPQLRNLALCEGGVLCGDPSTDRMSFADSHQELFASHGVCARAPTDPEFDQACFRDGDSFKSDLVAAATQPLTCGRKVSEFRAYAPRARWIRTANDSYFAAMTYPQGVAQSMQPADIHDATWGVLSAVYGGAVHPTAEGHAAMADSALVEAQRVLGLVNDPRQPMNPEVPPTNLDGPPVPVPQMQ